MTTLLILSAFVWGGWQGILLKIVIAVVVLWAARELIKWSEWPIPRPIEIIAIALAIILIVYWMFQLFNVLV